jgi:hypothetical protein
MSILKKKRGKPKGHISIKKPSDIIDVLAKAMNQIMKDPDPIVHFGKLASLANAYAGVYRLNLEEIEVQQLKEEILEIKKQLKENDISNRLEIA